VYWIHLKPREISKLFEQEYGFLISNRFVKKELSFLGFRFRKISKNIATGHYALRDAQFNIIFQLVLIMSLESPVLSIDCKKKERLGTIYREGKSYCHGVKEAYDHDYSHLGAGKVVPHGIYDLQQNTGFISIGNSSETATFIIDNLRWWWFEYGIYNYPNARNLLLLCDSGGGNSYRHHAFKKALQALAKEIGIDIIVSHYPPYSSKWNPIEHRLFCHVHQAMSGEMFENYDQVKMIIEKTSTAKGLNVFVRLNLKIYDIGNKTDKSEVNYDRIKMHPTIPKLNYRIYA
jgi:hypothetical protein